MSHDEHLDVLHSSLSLSLSSGAVKAVKFHISLSTTHSKGGNSLAPTPEEEEWEREGKGITIL